MLTTIKFIFGFPRSTVSTYSTAQRAAYAVFRGAYGKWLAEWDRFSAAQVALGLPAPNAGLIYAGQLENAQSYGVGVPLFWTYGDSGRLISPMDEVFQTHTPKDLLRAALWMSRVSPAQFWDAYNLPKGGD